MRITVSMSYGIGIGLPVNVNSIGIFIGFNAIKSTSRSWKNMFSVPFAYTTGRSLKVQFWSTLFEVNQPNLIAVFRILIGLLQYINYIVVGLCSYYIWVCNNILQCLL